MLIYVVHVKVEWFFFKILFTFLLLNNNNDCEMIFFKYAGIFTCPVVEIIKYLKCS